MRQQRVAVIGAGIAGLSAAIHLALDGHEVSVYEQRALAGGKAAPLWQGEYKLDPGPSIIILTRIYDDLFRRAGVNDYLRFQRLDPWSRIYQEGRDDPIDLPAEREACLEVLSTAEPGDAEGLRQLFRKIEKAAPEIDDTIFAHPYERPSQLLDLRLIRFAMRFNVRQSYKQLVDEHLKSSLLRSFFYGFPSYGGQSYYSKAPGALLIPFLMASEGVCYPEGGVSAIPAALYRLATEIGVAFHFGKTVTGLTHTRGSVSGVRFEDGDDASAGVVVSGMDRLTVEGMLGRETALKPSYSYYTIHMGVPRPMPGIDHHTLLVPKDAEKGFADLYERYQLPSPPVVYLNNPTLLDPSVAPPGSTNLFAVLTVPAEHDHLDWDTEGPRLREATYELMSRFGFPVDPGELDFEYVQDPRTFRLRDGSYRGSLYGPDEKERHLGGMFPLTNRDPEFSNLFYCGGSVQPGAGLPMAVLSGKFVAKMVSEI